MKTPRDPHTRENSDTLDKMVEILNGLISATEEPNDQPSFSITLKNGRSVIIWQSYNEFGFKWAYADALAPRDFRRPKVD